MVKKTSLAHAKAHLSSLVDDAEQKRRRTVIFKNGRAVAAIVPVDVAIAPRPIYSSAEIADVFGGFVGTNPELSTVDDLLDERRRR